MVLSDYITLIGIGFAQLSGHYIPWHIIPSLVNERGRLHRPLAYIYGSIWNLAGLAAFALAHRPSVNPWLAVQFLALSLIASSIGTLLPRILAIIIESSAKDGDIQDLEQLATRRGYGPSES